MTDTLAEPLSAEQIQALPLYDWEAAEIGDAAPPFTYLVTEASIADYCAAVRNDNPLYLDPEAAGRRDHLRRAAGGQVRAPRQPVHDLAGARDRRAGRAGRRVHLHDHLAPGAARPERPAPAEARPRRGAAGRARRHAAL